VRNFYRIAHGVDVTPLMHQLALNPDLWDQNTLRTTHPLTPHKDVSDVWALFNIIDPENPAATIDAIQTHPYEAWTRLPALKPLTLDLMRRVEGTQLGRVLITRLPPGKAITPHVDEGTPVTFYRRYQIALQSNPGALFTIEEEVVNFQSGEAWWINNRAEHSVVNNSSDDRIVVIADIRVI
jgi:hypothetical protein